MSVIFLLGVFISLVCSVFQRTECLNRHAKQTVYHDKMLLKEYGQDLHCLQSASTSRYISM